MRQKIVLKNRSFSMWLDTDTAALSFDQGVSIGEKAGKTSGQMAELLYDKFSSANIPLYEFYVGVSTKNLDTILEQYKLRYDVIVVKPGAVSGEFKKTSGHLHKLPVGVSLGFPEIYEVLHGTAMFLLQRSDGLGNIQHAAAIKTCAGEKILIPPGYEHATVNVGQEPLVFSDLISSKCKNEYGGIRGFGGMAYYVLQDQNGQPIFQQNPAYRTVPPIRMVAPRAMPQLGITFDEYVYDVLTRQPEMYAYLSDPNQRATLVHYLARVIEGENV